MTETSPRLSDVNVLIVDDQKTMRLILRNLLYIVGVGEVFEATNGAEALERLRAKDRPRIDAVICDLLMAEMDGIAFCNAIRRSGNARLRAVPILLLTAETDQFVLDVARQVGAAAIVPKPIDAARLKLQLARLLDIPLA